MGEADNPLRGGVEGRPVALLGDLESIGGIDILDCVLSATLDTELDRDIFWGSENCEFRRDIVTGLAPRLPPQAFPFIFFAGYIPGDSTVVMASNDFANVVISASIKDETSHMTVFKVVRFRCSLGGTATIPSSGMGISIPSGGV
jgi:hypothetical protein